jgi:hypothetical protein
LDGVDGGVGEGCPGSGRIWERVAPEAAGSERGLPRRRQDLREGCLKSGGMWERVVGCGRGLWCVVVGFLNGSGPDVFVGA